MRSGSRKTVGLAIALLVLAILAALALSAGYDAQADLLEEQRRHLAAPALGVEVGEGGVAERRQAVHGSHSARRGGVSA